MSDIKDTAEDLQPELLGEGDTVKIQKEKLDL